MVLFYNSEMLLVSDETSKVLYIDFELDWVAHTGGDCVMCFFEIKSGTKANERRRKGTGKLMEMDEKKRQCRCLLGDAVDGRCEGVSV